VRFMLDSTVMMLRPENITDLARYLIPHAAGANAGVAVYWRWQRRIQHAFICLPPELLKHSSLLRIRYWPRIERRTEKECEQCSATVGRFSTFDITAFHATPISTYPLFPDHKARRFRTVFRSSNDSNLGRG